jgi:hypothetical protein
MLRAWHHNISNSFSGARANFRPARFWPLLLLIVLCVVGAVHGPLLGQPIVTVSDASAAPLPATRPTAPPEPPKTNTFTVVPRTAEAIEPPKDLKLPKPIWDWLNPTPNVGRRATGSASTLTSAQPIAPATMLDDPITTFDANPQSTPALGDATPLGLSPIAVVVSSDPPADADAISNPEANVITPISSPLSGTPIPEPTSAWVAALSLLMLHRRSRRAA